MDQSFNNIKILNPSKIDKNDFIIITSTSYAEIVNQLIKKNLTPIKNFVISPILNDIKVLSELENKKINILFTSGAPPSKNKNYGGGLYKLEINNFTWKCKKLISGNCYGVLKLLNKYYVVDEQRGIIKLNKNLKIETIYNIQKNLRPHGLSHHKKTNRFYLNSTEQDAVYIYDRNFKFIYKIDISSKKKNTCIKNHPNNYNLILVVSLYVSMFSYSGNYLKEVYDGVILEYDINNLTNNSKIVKNNYGCLTT